MSHKVYMRDWYFNAGIIGFLLVAAEKTGKDPEKIEGLAINANSINLEDQLLEGFYEAFVKKVFLDFYNHQNFLNRFKFGLKEIDGENIEGKKFQKLLKTIGDNANKYPYKGLADVMDFYLAKDAEKEEAKNALEAMIRKLKDMETNQRVYSVLRESEKGKDFINYYVKDVLLKGICKSDSLKKYLESIKKLDYSKKIKPNDYCVSCQERKAGHELSNAISNVIGFNKDNTNWVWGYKKTKLKVCPVCALVYTCSAVSFVHILRKADRDWLDYYYFVNKNTDVKGLYKTVERFKLGLSAKQEKSGFFRMIRETILNVKAEQTEAVKDNVNFIEVVTNPILAGQSSKGYNVHNYNIDPKTAIFLQPYLVGDKKMPEGGYIINDLYTEIGEELLKLSINKQLGYKNLHRYISFHISGSVKAVFNPGTVTNFILDFIFKARTGKMEEENKVVKKGFRNGIELRQRLTAANRANQIEGLVYGFLNALKITDREKFLDAYIRIMMSHKMSVFFGENEMLDDDSFLQFGYSFINGLLAKSKEEIAKESQQTKNRQITPKI